MRNKNKKENTVNLSHYFTTKLDREDNLIVNVWQAPNLSANCGAPFDLFHDACEMEQEIWYVIRGILCQMGKIPAAAITHPRSAKDARVEIMLTEDAAIHIALILNVAAPVARLHWVNPSWILVARKIMDGIAEMSTHERSYWAAMIFHRKDKTRPIDALRILLTDKEDLSVYVTGAV